MDQSLRGIRFAPRRSLEAELLWRLRREGDDPDGRCAGFGAGSLVVLAALATGLLVFLFWVELLTL